MISIKHNEKPDLPICKMLCDGGIHKKLNNYVVSSFINCHSTNIFIGKPQSGKTALIYAFFKQKELLRKCYHTIYLFQPSHSRSSMKDKIFDKLPDNQKFEELNFDNLNEVLQRIKGANEDEKHCIIFDDMTAYLKNKETLKLLKELIFNRRHLHTSVFFLVQTWYSVPKDLRKLFSNIFCFRVAKKELEIIMDEVVEQKKYLAIEIAKLVFDEPYQYLFINTDNQRLFKGFDEIIFIEDEIK